MIRESSFNFNWEIITVGHVIQPVNPESLYERFDHVHCTNCNHHQINTRINLIPYLFYARLHN